MVEFLGTIAQGMYLAGLTIAQAGCLAGLAYGAYLSVTYSEDETAAMPVRYDPATGHVWTAVTEHRRHARA